MKIKSTLAIFLVLLTNVNAQDLKMISPIDSNEMIKNHEAIIIDVRELEETTFGAVRNAYYIPLSLMTTNKSSFDLKISKLPKDKQIIVYCRSGRRSSIVGHELQKRGFRVLNMGSFDSWKSAGFETEEKRK